MKVSRAPEKRGGINKILLYASLVVTVVIVGILITYFSTGFESRSATGDQTGLADLVNSSGVAPQDQAPAPTATPDSPVELTLLETQPLPPARVIPDVKFGEVLSQGIVDVDLPGNVTAESWYTFQVDTTTRDITLFFALYGSSPDIITRTVKIDGYTQRGEINQAELTFFYPEGPDRLITFDGEKGLITLTQQYQQPYGPSIFSPELRVALVNQKMVLTDDTGTIGAQLQLDLTGLSDSEQLVFQRSAPELVNAALSEIRALVTQIEDKRPQ